MKEPTWLRTLRAHARRSSIAAVARKLGCAKSTVSMVLAGRYRHSTKKLMAAVQKHLKPARRVRDPRPAQFRAVMRTLPKDVQGDVRRLIAIKIGREIGIDPDRVWPLINGTDKYGAADVLDKIKEALPRLERLMQEVGAEPVERAQ